MTITRNLCLLLPSLAILTACGGNDPEPNASAETQQEITSTETAVPTESTGQSYTVVLDADYPPYGLRDENGQADGFDVDVLRAIAADQGFSIELKPTSWDLLLNSLTTSDYPIAIGGIIEEDIVDEAQLANYSFSAPYAYARDAIATLPTTTDITSFEDIAELRVGVLADSSHIAEVEELQAQTEGQLIPEDTTFLALQELFQNKVDVVLSDEGVLDYYKQSITDYEYDIHQEGEYLAEPYEMVYMISKDNPELNEKIQMGIEHIVADGTYADIYQEWFGTSPEILPSI